MKRALAEVGVILACVAAGVALGYLQITEWRLDPTAYMVGVFVVAAVALWVGIRIERRYPVNATGRTRHAAGSNERSARSDRAGL